MADSDFDDCPDITHAAPTLLRTFNSRLDDILTKGVAPDSREVNILVSQIEPFQDSQALLDEILDDSVTRLCRAFIDTHETWICRVLYVFTKIRGAKTVSRFFPNEVTLVDEILQRVEKTSTKPTEWELRYVLLLWLAELVLTPFELERLVVGMRNRVYATTMIYAAASGREREAATVALARFLVRVDTISEYMPRFLSDTTTLQTSLFSTLGTISTLAQILAISSPLDLASYVPKISICIASVNERAKTSMQLFKFLGKAKYRLALVVLALATGTDIPEQVETCIDDLLHTGLMHKDTLVRYSASKAFTRVILALAKVDGDIALEAIDTLFETLFPSYMAVGGDSTVADKWHGGLLALAELLRRHAVPLAAYAVRVQEIIRCGLRFEVHKATHTIGANVRDAACYAAWSLFRHYPSLMSSSNTATLAQHLLSELVLVACFDREFNNRRAAAAAVQECVGRHGEVVPDLESGIALVQALDYFSIGNRTHSYLIVAPIVFQLGVVISDDTEQGDGMLEYLLHRTITNWDIDVRRLASRALASLRKIKGDQELVAEKLLDMIKLLGPSAGLEMKHGYWYALGQVLRAVDKVNDSTRERLSHIFDNAVFSTHQAFVLYDAALQVIVPVTRLLTAGTSKIVPASHTKIIEDVLSLTNENALVAICHATACEAVAELPSVDLDRYVELAQHGSKPAFMIAAGYSKNIVQRTDILSTILHIAGSNQKQHDISIREAALRVLEHVVATVPASNGHEGFATECARLVVYGLNDYTVLPSRGDVGSRVRSLCMRMFRGKTGQIMFNAAPEVSGTALEWTIRISLEKMDKLRREACETIRALLGFYESMEGRVVDDAVRRVREVFNGLTATTSHASEGDGDGDGGEVAVTHSEHDVNAYYAHMIRLCTVPDGETCYGRAEYATSAILGLAACVGSTTGESVMRAADDAVAIFLTTGSKVEATCFRDAVVEAFLQVPRTIVRRDYELATLVALVLALSAGADGNTIASFRVVLLSRIYNKAAKLSALALRMRSVPRMRTVISLLSELAGFCGAVSRNAPNPAVDTVGNAAIRKILDILTGNMAQAREAASSALFEILSVEDYENELGEIVDDKNEDDDAQPSLLDLLSSTDWNTVQDHDPLLTTIETQVLGVLERYATQK
ncbi:armadillo-type protein [Limtongia smithiae]|uniref:armadillo-type protein n=1 Tax=Limtongia smithiae TaxID=1125753 RepID=UPI0034CF294F